jgi:opacity protein-like surface antigen
MEEVMKKVVAIVAILVLMGSMSYGQEFVSSQASGAKALLFTWGGLADINATEYAPNGIGMKLFLSDYMCLRAQLQLAIANRTVPELGTGGKQGTYDATILGIGAAIEYHLSKGRVSPYIGGAVSFSTIGTEEKPPTVLGADQVTIKNGLDGIDMDGAIPIASDVWAQTNITIAFIIGAEYYITNGLSLGAEYRIGYTSTTFKDEDYTVSSGTTTYKAGSASGIGITSSGALTLAVYL